MSVLVDYFEYPHRRPGTDHGRFEHRYLKDAPAIAWPDGARVALAINVHLEHFPMDMTATPVLPIGGMNRVYPSVWDYTMRDYGNRVGIFRIMKILDELGLRANAVMNSEVAVRYPLLAKEILARNWEIVAGGVDMGKLHHSGIAPETEAAWVAQCVSTLKALAGDGLKGWHSSNHTQSAITPELVAGQGLEYMADWVNDDMPYRMRTDNGSLVALPLSYELSDRRVLFAQNQSLLEWEQQVCGAFDVLYEESARYAGRMLSLSLSPWVIAQPYRIQALRRVLAYMLGFAGVWNATGAEIVSSWSTQGEQP